LTHYQVHLFDIDVPGGIRFMESETLSSGHEITTFDFVNGESPTITIGLGICYDIRFAEMAMIMTRQRGAQILIYPSAFNMTTGPLHWELLARARAVDNQVFCVLCSPARDTSASYTAYGHSLIVDPWGKIVLELDESADFRACNLDLTRLAVRDAIPILKQRREDLYKLIEVGGKY
jgi:omega-amidase